MRQVIKFFLISLLCFAGCSKSSQKFAWENAGKVKVLSTTAMIDDLVEAIGGELVEHMLLIVGEMDPHGYELVKGDDEKIAGADLIVSNGLNLEHGASLRYQLEKHEHVIYLAEEIQKKAPEKILLFHGQYDPHVWMDVSLWAEGIDAIVESLSKQDPKNASAYGEKGKALREKMLSTHAKNQRRNEASFG